MQAHHKVLFDFLIASQQWVAAFNAGNARQCADTYIDNAVMEAQPFGIYTGRDAIYSFWNDLVSKGATNLQYLQPVLEVIDANTVLLSANWSMNIGHGRIYRERWVQQDGRWMLADDHFGLLGSHGE
ncbi:nuclear transport factor 2 family protein [Chitinimonas sp. PSY-7]|uniref:nuclear transport factor 2 family protein n=1 Tax=Chitinimonas sp. PSY-7 TaxID=3459088 RepID=UPI00403FF10B